MADFNPDQYLASAPAIKETKTEGFDPDSYLYDNPTEQIKTGLEGVAQGVAGPLATAAETHLFGVKPEDIEGRKKANPGTHMIGEAAGLIGGAAIPGLGEYSLGSKIAEGANAISKIAEGSEVARAAVKAASEMALIQASDETSNWISNDPNQSIQSAIAHIGLSAALGGAGGVIFNKAGSALKSLGEAPEKVAEGFKLNLDPMKANEPLFQSVPGASSKASAEGLGLGERIAKAIIDNASNAASEGLGAGIGASLGHMTGLPGAGWAGALLGERAISPLLKKIIPAIGKRVMDLDLSPAGFASAINAAEQAIKGRLFIEKATQSVFASNMDLPTPSQSDREKLDAKVKLLQNDTQAASSVLNPSLAHYMPEHAMSLGQTIGQSVQYLNSIRPSTEKKSPLDSDPVPNAVEESNYNRALDIAEQPAILMKNIKQGNLTSTDIKHLVSMYPALYDQMKSSLMNSMVDHLSKNDSVPYKTRLGLSLFMGQPLDSTMSPMSIMASQPPPSQIPDGSPGVKNTKHSTSSLNKIAKLDATPLQAREAHKLAKA